MIKLYGKPISHKNLKKLVSKIARNKNFTYFVALFTLLFVSETLRNPNNIFLNNLKNIVDNLFLKITFLVITIYIGYYNQTLGILILINLFFLLNIREKIEFFANQLPNLVDQNKILEYEKNFKPARKKQEVPKKNKKKTIEKTLENDEGKSKEIKKNTGKHSIKNPIKIKESEVMTEKITNEEDIKDLIKDEVEEVTEKIDNNELESSDFETEEDDDPKSSQKKKLYLKYYRKHQNNKKKELDDTGFAERDNQNIINKKSLEEYSKRRKKNKKYKEDLIDELKKVEMDQAEEKRIQNSKDLTIESQIKNSKLEKKKNLKILEDTEEDSSSSESSDSSESSSSSDSDKEYEDVSLTEAREHVLKKLRNKMKKDYVNDN